MDIYEQIKLLNEYYKAWEEDKIFHQERIKKCDKQMRLIRKQMIVLAKKTQGG